MRLYKFLTENVNIAELCPKVFNSNVALYRGMKGLSGSSGKMNVRKDRRPANSSPEFHDFVNKGFKSVFGINLRSEALFCTGSQKEAHYYGKTYRIWPSDDFTVYWSNEIKDLYEIAHKTSNFGTDSSILAFLGVYCLILLKKYYWSYEESAPLFDLLPKSRELLKVEFPKEWSNYVRMDETEPLLNKILEKYPNCATEFIKKYYKRGSSIKDLEEAANSGNEVMITCKYFCWETM